MGRAPCCDNHGQKKGPWSKEEDELLVDYIMEHGCSGWRKLPKLAGLLRCGKSCRLRWKNYLQPDIKRGPFTHEEENLIINLHGCFGNKWAAIASHFPGRTDNEIKNLWNTHIRKRVDSINLKALVPYIPAPVLFLASSGPIASSTDSVPPSTRHNAQWETAKLEAEARLSILSGVSKSVNEHISENDQPDHFLRMWNSEVGESFRKEGGDVKMECQSPISQKSMLIKEPKDETKQEVIGYSPMPVSESSCSSLDISSEIPLQYLLDFNCSDNMSFFDEQLGIPLF